MIISVFLTEITSIISVAVNVNDTANDFVTLFFSMQSEVGAEVIF
jgi:hypothetical protein